MWALIVAHLLSFFIASSSGASTFSPARPPSIPLAVRSPYLNTWLNVGSDGGDGGNLPGEWPAFWNAAITGWAGLIRVDGTAYTWLGDPAGAPSVTQTAFEYTATRSVFVLNVNEAVQLNVTFNSPVFPNDLKRQSLIFSYLDVAISSIDGASHDVQLYADISAEWVSGDRSTTAQWSYGVTGGEPTKVKREEKRSFELPRLAVHPRQFSPVNSTAGGIAYHKVWRQDQEQFAEVNDQTEYGHWYWATNNVKALTHQSGQDVVVRGQFESNGTLTNGADTDYRAIEDDYPVFAFAKNLGSVNATPVDTLFSIGLTQELAVQFDGAQGIVSEPSLWTQYWSTELEVLSFFHNDYSYASQRTAEFDNKLLTDATAAGGSDYYAITALTVRQAYGSMELAGTLNKTYMFMKEISSDGNVNTVDVMFPYMPIALYTNPTILKLLLDPLFENQESGQFPELFAMHDVGSSFPNATGHANGVEEDMPVEESGNMLIMTLAYAQRANDTAYLNQHYRLLNQWADYLIDNDTLIPAYQLSTDDFAGALANQTNLALKAIIAVEAMSKIANLTGHTEDSQNYTNIAHDWIQKWRNYGVAQNATPPHSELNYGNYSSWGLLYNLYADALLNTDLVPQSIYTQQSNFYPTVDNTYGVPLDTRHTYTKLDWQMWCAAIAEQSTQQMFFSQIYNWINTTPTNQPLTDLYDTVNGDYPPGLHFANRPVVGGTFALLALNRVTEGDIL